MLEVDFRETIAEPLEAAKTMQTFLGVEDKLLNSIAGAVEKKLYRNVKV